MSHSHQVIIEQDKDGYIANVPELKSCHTQGNSMEEVMKHIKEAIDLYLRTIRPNDRDESDKYGLFLALGVTYRVTRLFSGRFTAR